jgi:peptidoglycan pentaglycine glycine transferase (the first glycine)
MTDKYFQTNDQLLYTQQAFQGNTLEWNTAISRLTHAHILQTAEWGAVKETHGWKAIPQVWTDGDGELCAAALVLKRTISFGGFSAKLHILYVPRGPILDWRNENLQRKVLEDLKSLASKQGAIFIKIDPDVPLGFGIPESDTAITHKIGENLAAFLNRTDWQYSKDQIQFQNSVLLDIAGSQQKMLANMKQKTRYNIRLAERKGVLIRIGNYEDLSQLYRIYAETSIRDGFIIRSESYYKVVWQKFIQAKKAVPLIAEVDSEIIAGLFLFHFGDTAWYLYGMSSQSHRNKMPNYLLQWQAMKTAQELGCNRYDLWGAPDVFDSSDSMWGVFRFKLGLGGTVVRSIGAWDYSPRPVLYSLYTNILPSLLSLMRRRGRVKTQKSVDPLQ